MRIPIGVTPEIVLTDRFCNNFSNDGGTFPEYFCMTAIRSRLRIGVPFSRAQKFRFFFSNSATFFGTDLQSSRKNCSTFSGFSTFCRTLKTFLFIGTRAIYSKTEEREDVLSTLHLPLLIPKFKLKSSRPFHGNKWDVFFACETFQFLRRFSFIDVKNRLCRKWENLGIMICFEYPEVTFQSNWGCF